MSNEQHKEIQKLRNKIHRARAAFCHDESDGKAAARMLEILNEEDLEVKRIHTIPLNDTRRAALSSETVKEFKERMEEEV
jgi:hypothetical protein